MILAPISRRQKQVLIPTWIQRADARNEGKGCAGPAIARRGSNSPLKAVEGSEVINGDDDAAN